jgi:cell wall-associated NlpC family hydrolase
MQRLVWILLLLVNFAWAQVDPQWLFEVARRTQGHPYLWGGNGYGGFDCSGLVVYVYRHLGVRLPRTSREQYQAVRKVQELRPGDLLFFSDSRTHIDHVGIYLYPDPKTRQPLMLHASGKWGRVVVEPLERYRRVFVGAGRVL